jgi:hypothetical protein
MLSFHPCANKKAQGWGTVYQYVRAGSIEIGGTEATAEATKKASARPAFFVASEVR